MSIKNTFLLLGVLHSFSLRFISASTKDFFPPEAVFCPNKQPEDYCGCSYYDCVNTDFCDCAEAKDCCAEYEGLTVWPTEGPPEGSIVCEGNAEWDYCDCDWMCQNIWSRDHFCGCEKGLECCDGITFHPTPSVPEGAVVCEGLTPMEFCDCGEMCSSEDWWTKSGKCGCEEAESIECCGGKGLARGE